MVLACAKAQLAFPVETQIAERGMFQTVKIRVGATLDVIALMRTSTGEKCADVLN